MELDVYREVSGGFQLVGVFSADDGCIAFEYAESYAGAQGATGISSSLPLDAGSPRYEGAAVASFFDGLLPEGSLRRGLSGLWRLDASDVAGLLDRLNNESAGALVFKEVGDDPAEGRGYEPVDADALAAFAANPSAVAIDAAGKCRLSLAGAQSKIGLFHEGGDMLRGWSRPVGCAPTNCIVKAGNPVFPNQTVNEVLCMLTAAKLGHDVASCSLIAVEGCEPLLAVERFDRADLGGDFLQRLHQEDFCQALGLRPSQKYEPTDGHYAGMCANLLSRHSSNGMGDRMGLFSGILLSWALGNCDNHLKNYSLLRSPDWGTQAMSPFYDLTCTLLYPQLELEMGVSLCPSRRIVDVGLEDIVSTARSMGIGKKMALEEYVELREGFEPALREAAAEIAAEGFPQVEPIAGFMLGSFNERCRDLAARKS